MKRIHCLLHPKPNGTVVSFLAVTILILAASVSVSARQSASSITQPNSSMGSAYTSWLHEDAAYIITNAERTQFESLPTDKDRDKFIEQFWLHHDPPGAQANTFKAEHYRRIAFSNLHFAAGLPGWQTDRGHIYIVYGPPDAIDSHAGEEGHAVQVWRYRHVPRAGNNGSVTFVDATGKGDFQLAPNK